MAASAGKKNKPRNPKKRKATPEKTPAIFVCQKSFWPGYGLVFVWMSHGGTDLRYI
jgi:hypothetical protein